MRSKILVAGMVAAFAAGFIVSNLYLESKIQETRELVVSLSDDLEHYSSLIQKVRVEAEIEASIGSIALVVNQETSGAPHDYVRDVYVSRLKKNISLLEASADYDDPKDIKRVDSLITKAKDLILEIELKFNEGSASVGP